MRYFFNIRSNDRNDIDSEGIDLPDLDEAREEARKSAREMVAELVRHGDPIDGARFEIADGDGRVLETIWFRDMINLD